MRSRPPEKRSYMSGALSNRSRADRPRIVLTRLANPHARDKPRLGATVAREMSRFSEPQDPLFHALNSSIGFDYRLAPYDLEQSLRARPHARPRGIIGDEDLGEIERGLSGRAGDGGTRFVVEPTTRTSTWRSSGD